MELMIGSIPYLNLVTDNLVTCALPVLEKLGLYCVGWGVKLYSLTQLSFV